jgi:hypothetical protein
LSARHSTDGGTVRPRAFAVFKLMTVSNLVGAFHRQVPRLGALENLVDEDRGPPKDSP